MGRGRQITELANQVYKLKHPDPSKYSNSPEHMDEFLKIRKDLKEGKFDPASIKQFRKSKPMKTQKSLKAAMKESGMHLSF